MRLFDEDGCSDFIRLQQYYCTEQGITHLILLVRAHIEDSFARTILVCLSLAHRAVQELGHWRRMHARHGCTRAQEGKNERYFCNRILLSPLSLLCLMAMMQAAMHMEDELDMMDIHNPAVPEHKLLEAFAFIAPDALDIAAVALAAAAAGAGAGTGADAGMAADGGVANDAVAERAAPGAPPTNAAEAAVARQQSTAAFNEQISIVRAAVDTARNQFLIALVERYAEDQRPLIGLSIGNLSNFISTYTNAVRDRDFVYADGLPETIRATTVVTIHLLEQQLQQPLAQDVDQLHLNAAAQCVKHSVIAYLQQILDAFRLDRLPTRHRAIRDAVYYCSVHSNPAVSHLMHTQTSFRKYKKQCYKLFAAVASL
jgi:hypothetical protein